ncbi:MAG TPA: pyruvate kinase [Methanospirillum sp.]|uniref:pyruvate kinase n=1 Tax=Methanospirillum sp. TaxID=45200 RepID=UPI002C9985B1|nr:pyruvate kinase [Methanospirillum sp.]HWQ64685.1 pyruvate kinase [Methanospirillum sp.]
MMSGIHTGTDTPPGPGVRLTRIIATIGPASADIETISEMIRAGMDIARLNLSHGSLEQHQETMAMIRHVARDFGRQVAVMIDIPGPKLRVRSLPGPDGTFSLHEEVILSADPHNDEIGIGPAAYIPMVCEGDAILLADGAVLLRVTSASEKILAEVVSGGSIRIGAGVVIPGRRPDIPYANDELVKNLSFAAELNPDFIALSFVGSAADITVVRSILSEKQAHIPLIAKVETKYAVDLFDEILAASDGIMVARGDLGVELPIACVPYVQKEIIRSCNKAGKPVITATEMLESMVEHGRPTRAEVTDVANAIADGTDATMLSAETSIGKDPARVVRMMAEIACETERHLPYRAILDERRLWHETGPSGIISYSACYLANELESRAIVAFTRSGITAERVSRCRPGNPILAITPDEQIARRLLIRWGVIPCIHTPIHTADELFFIALELAKEKELITSGDRLIIIAGNFAGVQGRTNMIKVQNVP